MKLPKLPKFKNTFKKKQLSDEEAFLKKALNRLPRSRRKKARVLYDLAKKGYFIRVGQDIDNKKVLKPGVEYYNGQVI